MYKQLLTGTTALAIALTSIAPAASANSLPSWKEAIDRHEARIAAGKWSGATLGKHSNAIFKPLSGRDGFIFGNVLNDDVVLPRVTDVTKVIEAAKKGDKPVVVASNDWILPSNALLCAVAEQVKMECGDFTVEFMRGSSDLSDAEFNEFLTSQSAQLKEIAKMIGAVTEGDSELVKLLKAAGHDITANYDVIDAVKHLIEDEVNLETLEAALQNWDATVAAIRAGELEGHIAVYAEIMAGIQDEVDFLAAERERLQGELAVAKAEIVRQDNVIAGLESSLASTQAALASSQASLASTQSALAASEAANADLSAQVSNLTGSLAAANSSISGLNAEIASLEAQLAAKQAQINSLIAQRDSLQTDLNNANTQASNLQNQINGTEVEDGHHSTVVINTDGSVTVTGANAGTYASQVVGGDTITYTDYSAYLQDEWFTVNSESSLRDALVKAKGKGTTEGWNNAIKAIAGVVPNFDPVTDGFEIYGDNGIRKAIQNAIAAAGNSDVVTFSTVTKQDDISYDEYQAADQSFSFSDERNSITITLSDGSTKVIGVSTWDASTISSITKITDGQNVSVAGTRTVTESGDYLVTMSNGKKYKLEVNVNGGNEGWNSAYDTILATLNENAPSANGTIGNSLADEIFTVSTSDIVQSEYVNGTGQSSTFKSSINGNDFTIHAIITGSLATLTVANLADDLKDAYNAGYNDGFDDGYSTGYKAGYNDAIGDFTSNVSKK